jgi:hypothetical protein
MNHIGRMRRRLTTGPGLKEPRADDLPGAIDRPPAPGRPGAASRQPRAVQRRARVILDGVEPGGRSAPLQDGVGDRVGQLRVPGEDRAVQVGGEQVAAARPLGPVGAVVAVAADHRRQWLRSRPQHRPPAVVLEPGEQAPARHPRDHLADAAGRLGHRLEVEHAQPRHAPAGAVGVDLAEELEAAAHRQGRDTAGQRDPQAATLPPEQQLGGGALVQVLAAAEHVRVEPCRHRHRRREVDHLGGMAAPP